MGCVPLLFVLFTLPCCLSVHGQQQEPPNIDVQSSSGLDERGVLRHLDQYDSIYRSGFAATAAQRRMDRIDIHGPFFKVQARWRLTFEGDRTGYVVDVTDYENPQYLPADQRAWANRDIASRAIREVAMPATVRIKEWGYWGEEACGNHHVEASLKVNPDGQVTQRGTMYNSYLYPPRDISLIAAQRTFQWALGRFFSERLHKVVHVDAFADGRLHVSALGDMYKGANGTWKLEIESASAWMVRKATFHPESQPDRIDAEMTNEGTVWSGPFCSPKAARINFWGPIEDMDTVPATHTQYLTFEPVVDKFDETLYDQCQQAVLHCDQPNATLTDARLSPPTVTQPNRPAFSDAPEVALSPFSPLRKLVVIVNLIVIIGLSTIVVFRRKWKRANRSIGA